MKHAYTRRSNVNSKAQKFTESLLKWSWLNNRRRRRRTFNWVSRPLTLHSHFSPSSLHYIRLQTAVNFCVAELTLVPRANIRITPGTNRGCLHRCEVKWAMKCGREKLQPSHWFLRALIDKWQGSFSFFSFFFFFFFTRAAITHRRFFQPHFRSCKTSVPLPRLK